MLNTILLAVGRTTLIKYGAVCAIVCVILLIIIILIDALDKKVKSGVKLRVTDQPIPYDKDLVRESVYISEVALGKMSMFLTNTFPAGYRRIDDPCSYGHGKLVKTPRELYELYTRYKFVKPKEEKDKE